MKKIISLVLVVLMIAMAMTACKSNGTGAESSTPADSIPEGPASGTDTTDATAPETDPTDEPGSLVFADCDEKVYVVDVKSLNLRSTPNFDDDSAVAATVAYGTELRRIGKSDVWSKVVYNNAEYYVSTKYVSTTKPDEISFTDCDETVYVLQDANYRSIPSMADSAMVDTIAKGTAVKRTGVMYEPVDAENNPDGVYGWSRVEIEGKVYYMRNSVLTTTAPEAAETPAATEATPAATETAPVVDEH